MSKVLLLVAVLESVAIADPDIAGAKKYNDAAGVAMQHQEYEEAAAGYIKANSLAPNPGVMFNAAQAYRLASAQGATEKNVEKASKNRDVAGEWYRKSHKTKRDQDK